MATVKQYVRIKLLSISYGGESVGDDTDFVVSIGGTNVELKNDLDVGQTKTFKDKEVFHGSVDLGTTGTGSLDITAAVTEDDLIYPDHGSGALSVALDGSAISRTDSMAVTVTETGALFSAAVATFTFSFEIEAMPVGGVKYLATTKDDWLFGKTDGGLIVHVFYGEKVEFTRYDDTHRRQYMRTLEGPYEGEEFYMSLDGGGLKHFVDVDSRGGAFSARFVIKPKSHGEDHDSGSLYVDGVAEPFKCITDIHNADGSKWTNGKVYEISLPDHPRGKDYITEAPHSRTWFLVRLDAGAPGLGGAFLHAGKHTAGCITVTDLPRWEEVYQRAVLSRLGDDKHIGTVKVVIEKPKK